MDHARLSMTLYQAPRCELDRVTESFSGTGDCSLQDYTTQCNRIEAREAKEKEPCKYDAPRTDLLGPLVIFCNVNTAIVYAEF